MRKIIIILLLMLILTSFTYSVTSGNTTFTNLKHAENITFTGYQNKTRFLDIFRNAYLTNITISLRGNQYNNTNNLNLVYDQSVGFNSLRNYSASRFAEYFLNGTLNNQAQDKNHLQSNNVNVTPIDHGDFNFNVTSAFKDDVYYNSSRDYRFAPYTLGSHWEFTVFAVGMVNNTAGTQIIASHADWDGPNDGWMVGFFNGKGYAHKENNDANSQSVLTGSLLQNNTWFSIVYVVSNSANERVYYNGEEVHNQQDMGGDIGRKEMCFTIGTVPSQGIPCTDDPTYSFNGNLSYVAFYNNSNIPAQAIAEWHAEVSNYIYPHDVLVDTDITQYNHTAKFNHSVNISLNVTHVKNILNDGCDCTNCSIQGSLNEFCRIPFIFQSSTPGLLEYSNITIDYHINLALIDEVTNTPFNVQNLSGVKAYLDDNTSIWDYKAQNTNQSNLTLVDSSYRIELTYGDGTIINRYINPELLTKNIRVCANIEGVTHYEQLIVSATQREALLESDYAKCYVAADYTRFGYETAYVLKAFTIDRGYTLYTYQDGNRITLVGIDGSIASYMNLDTIELQQLDYNLDILKDALVFQKTGTNTMAIQYRNQDSPNSDISISILRMDNGATVYNNDDFDNKDDITIYFDYTGLDINDSTLFKIDVERTSAEGTSEITRFFNTGASSGVIPAAVAFAISLFIAIFGLTFTQVKLTFSFFGIFILIIAIAVLSFAVQEWYIIFLMVMEILTLIYIVFVSMTKNVNTLAG